MIQEQVDLLVMVRAVALHLDEPQGGRLGLRWGGGEALLAVCLVHG